MNNVDSHPYAFQTRRPRHLTSAIACVMAIALLGACASKPTASAPRCSDAVQARVSASKPTITVAYTEPSMNQAGKPLKELVKTSVYYDLGSGRILAKEVPSTKPAGGGQISEMITLPVKEDRETVVYICVTATDRQGLESAATP